MNLLLPPKAKNIGLFFVSFLILAGVMLWEKPQYNWTLVFITTLCLFIAGFGDAHHRGQTWLECILFGILMGFVGFAAAYLGTLYPEIHDFTRLVLAFGVTSVLWLTYYQRLYPISRHPWAAIFGLLSANSLVQYLWRHMGIDLWIAVMIGLGSFVALQAIVQSKETLPANKIARNRYEQQLLKQLEEDLENTLEKERKKK